MVDRPIKAAMLEPVHHVDALSCPARPGQANGWTLVSCRWVQIRVGDSARAFLGSSRAPSLPAFSWFFDCAKRVERDVREGSNQDTQVSDDDGGAVVVVTAWNQLNPTDAPGAGCGGLLLMPLVTWLCVGASRWCGT